MYTPQLLTTRSWIPCSSTLAVSCFFWHHFKVSRLHLSPDDQWQSFSCVRSAWFYPVVLSLLQTHFSTGLWAQPLPVPRQSLVRASHDNAPIPFQPSPVLTGRSFSSVHFSIAEMLLCCSSGFPVLFAFLQKCTPASIQSRLCRRSPLHPSVDESQRKSCVLVSLLASHLHWAIFVQARCWLHHIQLTHKMLLLLLAVFWMSTAVLCLNSSSPGLPGAWLLKECCLVTIRCPCSAGRLGISLGLLCSLMWAWCTWQINSHSFSTACLGLFISVIPVIFSFICYFWLCFPGLSPLLTFVQVKGILFELS